MFPKRKWLETQFVGGATTEAEMKKRLFIEDWKEVIEQSKLQRFEFNAEQKTPSLTSKPLAVQILSAINIGVSKRD